MTLQEARRILAEQDTRSPVLALEAVAMVLRHEAIADRRLLPVAESIERVAGALDAQRREALRGRLRDG